MKRKEQAVTRHSDAEFGSTAVVVVGLALAWYKIGKEAFRSSFWLRDGGDMVSYRTNKYCAEWARGTYTADLLGAQHHATGFKIQFSIAVLSYWALL